MDLPHSHPQPWSNLVEIDLYPLAWQTVAKLIAVALERDNFDPQTRTYLLDALAEITSALEDEAERQHLDRSYPEGF